MYQLQEIYCCTHLVRRFWGPADQQDFARLQPSNVALTEFGIDILLPTKLQVPEEGDAHVIIEFETKYGA